MCGPLAGNEGLFLWTSQNDVLQKGMHSLWIDHPRVHLKHDSTFRTRPRHKTDLISEEVETLQGRHYAERRDLL